MTSDEDVIISTGQAAHLLKVSHGTINRWINDGRLPYVQRTPGGHYRLRLSEVKRLLADPPAGRRHTFEGQADAWWAGLEKPAASSTGASSTGSEQEQAQGLVEFAMVLPILLLLLIGGLYFGLVMIQVTAMNNAADAGAFYASLGHPETEVRAHVQLRLREQLVNPDEVGLTISPPVYSYGDVVTVAMTKTMRVNAILWKSEFAIPIQSTQIVQKQVLTGTTPSP